MNVGSLFSGAGLMDWGLTLAGFDHAWFCESDPYCRRILERRWPGVAVHKDVCTLVSPQRVDLLAGGFPCQDLSQIGGMSGIIGKRSGLWGHFARLVGELRPRYVLVENVSGLRNRGLGKVLGDLATLGYDAEWDCLPAAAFGSPQLRDRFFLLAHPREDWQRSMADPQGYGLQNRARENGQQNGQGEIQSGMDSERGRKFLGRGCCSSVWPPQPHPRCTPWPAEPNVGRVADGVPARVDRLRALGNGVVPQISRYIGERILEREGVIVE